MLTETLTCPVCTASVAVTSSMCLSCHLPIKDVRANQKLSRRSSKTRHVGSWLWTRIIGLAFYAGAVTWCALKMPTSLTFVVPGAVVGCFVHVVKGKPWLGLLAFLLIVALTPLLFWPSMLTDTLARLTNW